MSRARALTSQFASILQYTTHAVHSHRANYHANMQRECDWLSNNTEIMHVQFMKKLVHQIDRFSLLTRIGRVDITVIGDNIEINGIKRTVKKV